MFQNQCSRVTSDRINIIVGSGEEARVSAEIHDGAIQVHVSWKFVWLCNKKAMFN